MRKFFLLMALCLTTIFTAEAKKPFTIHAETQEQNLLITIIPEDNSKPYFCLPLPVMEMAGIAPDAYFNLIKQQGLTYLQLVDDGFIKAGTFQYVFDLSEMLEEDPSYADFVVAAVHVDNELNETSDWVTLNFIIAEGLDVTTEEDSPYKEENGWVYYDDGIMVSPFGPGSGTFHWGIMFPANTLNYSTLYKVAVYESAYNTDPMGLIIRAGGDTPDKAMTIYTQAIQPSENVGLHVLPLTQALNFDNTKNLWITFSAPAGWPAVVCADAGDPNSRWYSMDGENWGDLANTQDGKGNRNEYSFIIRACFENTQAVNTIQGDKVQSTKLFRDGQLFIEKNGVIYNAQGAIVK